VYFVTVTKLSGVFVRFRASTSLINTAFPLFFYYRGFLIIGSYSTNAQCKLISINNLALSGKSIIKHIVHNKWFSLVFRSLAGSQLLMSSSLLRSYSLTGVFWSTQAVILNYLLAFIYKLKMTNCCLIILWEYGVIQSFLDAPKLTIFSVSSDYLMVCLLSHFHHNMLVDATGKY
jgi:hypothetical protein